MSHPFLPKLRSDKVNRFAPPNAIGVWEERPNSSLEQLAEGIDIPLPPPGKKGEAAQAPRKIHSVPNPWARVILFDRALYDESHPLHRVTLGEWRGVLAVLALRHRRNFEGINAREIDLNGNPGKGSFSSVLRTLIPDDGSVISPDDTRWGKFHIFRWQSKSRPFAFTSPMTLVCGAADYANVLKREEVPWFDGRVLTDPRDSLSARERKGLAEWILIVHHKLAGATSQRRGQILELLDSFAKELSVSATLPPIIADVLGTLPLGLHTGIFGSLDHALKKQEGDFSDVEIESDFKETENAPRYFLIDPASEKAFKEPAREILIFGDVSLATSKIYTQTGQSIGVIKPGLNWCTPDFFFSDTLIYDLEDGTFPNTCYPVNVSGTSGKRVCVFPITRGALELFTPETLVSHFSLVWGQDGSAVCRLKIGLMGSNAAGHDYILQKTYPESKMARVKQVPLVSIWPNFRVSAWKAYYTFQKLTEGNELKVTPWAASEKQPIQQRKIELSSDRRFLSYRNTTYPTVLVCETPLEASGGGRASTATGLILLVPPKQEPTISLSTATLGIDFGSTGTKLYYRVGEEGEPDHLTFSNRVQKITSYDSNQFIDFSRSLFLPAQDWVEDSILSVYHDFGDPPGAGDNERTILRDGHILFLNDPAKVVADDRDRDRILANLKWGDDPRERTAAREFLMQLCLQAGAEMAYRGVKTLDLRFSTPTAFSKYDQHAFERNWGDVPGIVGALTGLNFTIYNREETEHECREAVTAARYFEAFPGEADITGGALTLDIGGGTTDIAIWRDMVMLGHNSVVFAGRDILLLPLRERPQVLKDIEPRINLELIKAQRNDHAFQAQLDALVASQGQALIRALPVKDALPSVRGLLSILEVGLCGIGFYTGLMLQRLIASGEFDKTKYKSLSIFVGGNGSKLFHWCARGQFKNGTLIYDRFTSAFLAGADCKGVRVHMQLSENPKAEVAYGLVAKPMELKVSNDPPKRMAGESYFKGSEKIEWTEFPSWQELKNGDKKISVDRDLPVFRQFLQSIERKPDEDVLDRIGGEVNKQISKRVADISAKLQRDPYGESGENRLRNEPLFVFALKAYLESRIKDWVSRG